jgi:hypothetical protein
MSKKIEIGNEYYLFNDKDFDRFFNQILTDHSEYTLKDNGDDIKTYFADNVEEFFDNIPLNEDTDYSDVIDGFNEYIDWLLTF